MPITNGPIFTSFRAAQTPPLSQETQDCSARTVDHLIAENTTTNRPGMLLGQVQSGKTRAFLGAIAMAFDNGYDVAIILTKGTKALTRQTLRRVQQDFRQAINNDEAVHAFDVMLMPETLNPWDLDRKLIIVCKKEDDNLNALIESVTVTYPVLTGRRFLIVDDEADFASVSYRRTPSGIQPNVIPAQIDQLRSSLANVSFLQVTATPYSLYLQPEDIEIPATQTVFQPIRPAFTEIVPVHAGYVGGRYYFEDSQQPNSVASYLFVPIQAAELTLLRRPNWNLFNPQNCLANDQVAGLRRAITTFVVAGWIRRWQPRAANEAIGRFAMIVHTETGKPAHDWQADVVQAIVQRMLGAAQADIQSIRPLIEEAFYDLSQSLAVDGHPTPTLDEVVAAFPTALLAVNIEKVNSDADIDQLLNDSGQLRLRSPYNIFIGGQILDRGVTIDNLLGFFYGRTPQRTQQDTVLQHSRMYGNRPLADLAVTRFYTTTANYLRMQMIYEFDTALRTAIENQQQAGGGGVVFLRTDPNGRVAPCAPNKVLLSTLTTLRPNKRLIPSSFSTTLHAAQATTQIDQILQPYRQQTNEPMFMISLADALAIVDQIAISIQRDDPEQPWDVNSFKESLRHLAVSNPDENERDQVACLVRTNRNDRKVRPSGRLQNAPEGSADDRRIDQIRGQRPALLLYRVNGNPVDAGNVATGWTGIPFWWPVLQAPETTVPVVFAAEAIE